jgi:homoserine/homoserine lactone efflux protein
MELNVFLSFIIATTIMIALPGPSVLLTVANSISFGRKYGILTVLGATMGIAIQLIITAIGLASLLNTIAEAFKWLRWAGAIYLIFLGIKQWQSSNKPIDFNTTSTSNKNVFVQGLVTTIFNPKSLIFIAAFLPQFINLSRPTGLQFSIIIPTFLLITFAVTSLWALIAGKLREFIKNQKTFRSILRVSGGLMILAGFGLILARRSK